MACKVTLRALRQDLERGGRRQEAYVPAGPAGVGRAGVSCSLCGAQSLRPAAPSGPQSPAVLGSTPSPSGLPRALYTAWVVCWGQGKCVGVSEGQIPQPPSTLCPPPWPLLGLRFGVYLFATLTSPNSPSAESGRACAAGRRYWDSADGWPTSPGDTGYHHHPPSTPTCTRTPGPIRVPGLGWEPGTLQGPETGEGRFQGRSLGRL